MTGIIVRRRDVQTYDRLYNAWGHLVPVIWDRRRTRPRAHADTAPSARHPDRRREPPPSWTAFGYIEVGCPAAWRQATLSAWKDDRYSVVQANAPTK